jgi:DnaJ-domain-containing protein 1
VITFSHANGVCVDPLHGQSDPKIEFLQKNETRKSSSSRPATDEREYLATKKGIALVGTHSFDKKKRAMEQFCAMMPKNRAFKEAELSLTLASFLEVNRSDLATRVEARDMLQSTIELHEWMSLHLREILTRALKEGLICIRGGYFTRSKAQALKSPAAFC